MNEIILQAISGFAEVAIVAAIGIATYYIKTAVIPWLKEKHLYDTVKKFVQAAEKLGDVGTIPKGDKKAYVVRLLEGKGIIVTPEVEALIESAVKELDNAVGEIVGILADETDSE